MTTHIVAAGGGGFSMDPLGAPTRLDRYLLDLTGKSAPLVCFAPTASADDPQYINKFLMAYGHLGIRPMILTLWHSDTKSEVERLLDADLVLVGGGHTVNMMALWKAHKVDRALKALAEKGDVVLAGVSAGGACWFEGCVTDSFGDAAPWRGGLELLPGSFCPHYDGELDRAPTFTEAVSEGDLPGGWAADDGAAIHFEDGKPVAFIAEKKGQKVYHVMPSESPTSSGVLAEQQEMKVL